MRTVVVPMAGHGTRLKALAENKILHPIGPDQVPLFVWSIRNLGFHYDRLILVTRKEHGIPEIADRWLSSNSDLYVVELDEDTSGPLDSVLKGTPHFGEGELVVANSDQVMQWPGDWALDWFRKRGAVGGIPTVERNSPRHSYVKLDPNYPHRIVQVEEKEILSNRATIGIYWFRSSYDFVNAAQSSMQSPLRAGMREYYVAPVYNHLQGLILEYPLSEFWSLGEPENMRAYLEKDYSAASQD